MSRTFISLGILTTNVVSITMLAAIAGCSHEPYKLPDIDQPLEADSGEETAPETDADLPGSSETDSAIDTDLPEDTDTPIDTDLPEDTDTPIDTGEELPAQDIWQIVTGGNHSCALLNPGIVRCWGANYSGELGYGNLDNIGDNEIPADLDDVDMGGLVTQLAAGDFHTCALLDTGTVRCWGYATYGRLGYGNLDNLGDDETPAEIGDIDIGGTVVQITAGSLHTCALLENDAVRCWGSGNSGRLGYGNTDDIGDDETPATAGSVPVGGHAVQIVAGYAHTCAILDTGDVRCWGAGSSGRLGYGNSDDIGDNETPATAGNVQIGGRVVQLGVGGFHSCALLDTAQVRCWGNANYGRLGYENGNHIGDNEAPETAGDVDIGGNVTQLAVGMYHTCVILDTGGVRCWGGQSFGNYGQLGYSNTDTVGDDESPAEAGDVLVGAAATQISAGKSHTCATLETDAVRCWGYSGYGQLGYGNTQSIGDNEAPAAAGDVPLF